MPLLPVTAGLTVASSIATETYNEFVPVQFDRPRSTIERKYTNEASSFVELDGARVHYRDEGTRDGPVVLALHGTYSSLHTWDGWVEQLRDDVRVIRMDMPGFGVTGPREEGEHTLSALIETVATFCDEFDLSDITLAGNSLGGAVAWRLAIDRPDLVSRLILVDAGGATLLSNLADNYRSLGTNLLPRYLTPRLVTRLALNDAYYDTSKVTGDLVNRYHDLLLGSGNRRAVMELARNYKETYIDEETADLSDVGTPILPSSYHNPTPVVHDPYDIADVEAETLMQWGAEDTWLPVSFGRELAAKVENCRFVTYEEVGHVPMEEAPERTSLDAAAFIHS